MAYKFTGAPRGPINVPKPSPDIPLSKGEENRLKNKGKRRIKNKEPIPPTPRYEQKVKREKEEEKRKKQQLLSEQENAPATEESEVTTTETSVSE